ncbi:hypothetical protein ACLQ2R_19735 [Streptosporangium sp. DT93]|uniref:hypothetical protein n=1 Tax=Streptosporangium sp. DT93 TaxID=3393428 RepID=UPI003CEA5AD2
MSFTNFARKVRDPALPHRHRVSALRSCVQLYRPLGFHATLSFLELRAGRFQNDETALLGALEVIEASRAARQDEITAYATMRREAKRQGRRNPHEGDPNPHTQSRWYRYGAPREAARHALSFWLRRRPTGPQPLMTDPALAELRWCVSSCLEFGGEPTAMEGHILALRMKELERHLQSWDLLHVVRHIEVAAGLR